MRGLSRLSTGRSDGSHESSMTSNPSHPFLQRKRTLEEFPMEYNLQATRGMLQERRQRQINQKQNLISSTGESIQLSSYSRSRFQAVLATQGKDSLPPPSGEERRLFWMESRPSWTSHRRHTSMSAPPVSQPVLLAPRPGSGPAGAFAPNGRPAFNHLRGNSSAYPTIQKILQDSNAGYRVVCPCAPTERGVRSRRPSLDCSTVSDYILVPVDDEEPVRGEGVEETTEEEEEEEVEEQTREEEDVHNVNEEDNLCAEEELNQDHKVEAVGGVFTTAMGEGPGGLASTPKSKRGQKLTDSQSVREPEQTVTSPGDDGDDEDHRVSPWYCWLDDATVSSVCTDHSAGEVNVDDVTPGPSQAADLSATDKAPGADHDLMDKGKLSVPHGTRSQKQTTPASGTPSPEVAPGKRRSTGRVSKRKGGKRNTPDPKETIELPPPPPRPPTPPVEEERVVDIEAVEEIPEAILPSYICPSSVLKSSLTETKLWLNKTSFSSANKLLPIH